MDFQNAFERCPAVDSLGMTQTVEFLLEAPREASREAPKEA